MRLSRKEIEIILKVANEIYGKGVKVYLFGSRTDENKRGGKERTGVRGIWINVSI